MPNWCFNEIRFTGSTGDITNLIEFVEEQSDEGLIQFSFNSIIPLILLGGHLKKFFMHCVKNFQKYISHGFIMNQAWNFLATYPTKLLKI